MAILNGSPYHRDRPWSVANADHDATRGHDPLLPNGRAVVGGTGEGGGGTASDAAAQHPIMPSGGAHGVRKDLAAAAGPRLRRGRNAGADRGRAHPRGIQLPRDQPVSDQDGLRGHRAADLLAKQQSRAFSLG